MKMACHSTTSHFIESIFTSNTLTKETKLDFYKKLVEGRRFFFNQLADFLFFQDCTQLVQDKCGSRVVESIWTHTLSVDERAKLCTQLCTNMNVRQQLLRSPWGKAVTAHFNLDIFRQSPKDWRTAQQQKQATSVAAVAKNKKKVEKK
jgi:hypothetical protein